ncbi:hypothetical protein E2542_SST16878 [Spatholobus suberectus]|nr:hypothetical protein E2542_SST16878 [Spatholobus suberectus]
MSEEACSFIVLYCTIVSYVSASFSPISSLSSNSFIHFEAFFCYFFFSSLSFILFHFFLQLLCCFFFYCVSEFHEGPLWLARKSFVVYVEDFVSFVSVIIWKRFCDG